MKSFYFPNLKFALFGALACAAMPLSSRGAASTPSPQPAAKSEVKADVLPKSLFVIPRDKTEGRDPFFPTSIRVYNIPVPPVVTPTTTVAPVPVTYEFKLKGFSGAADNRLAIINNQTLAVGDEAEVTTPTGRVRVKLIEIKDDVAWIQVGGERRALQMRPNF
jgi:hypothetical protein